MMGKCGGIAKTSKTFGLREDARYTMKISLLEKLDELFPKLKLLITLGHASEVFQQKINALKATFNALCGKNPLDLETLNSAEKILLQLRRIYITQKVAYETKLKEDEKAALAECNADDFMPKHMDN